MDPNIVIKQEPVDTDEVEMVAESVPLDPLVKVKSEKRTSPSSKSSKAPKKSKLHKKEKVKRKSKGVPGLSAKEEKMKKIPKTEKDALVEPPRAEVYPDHSMSDFYCTVCDSHVNSVQVWESHIQGKRHVKNIKKEFGVTSVKKEKVDDNADLYYIDTRGAQSPSSFNNANCERRPLSPTESKRRKWYSPEPSSPVVKPSYTSTRNFDLSNMTTSDKMDYICKLTESIYPQNESDFAEIKSIISAFSQSILQYEIRQLPLAVQQKLAKELFRGK